MNGILRAIKLTTLKLACLHTHTHRARNRSHPDADIKCRSEQEKDENKGFHRCQCHCAEMNVDCYDSKCMRTVVMHVHNIAISESSYKFPHNIFVFRMYTGRVFRLCLSRQYCDFVVFFACLRWRSLYDGRLVETYERIDICSLLPLSM